MFKGFVIASVPVFLPVVPLVVDPRHLHWDVAEQLSLEEDATAVGGVESGRTTGAGKTDLRIERTITYIHYLSKNLAAVSLGSDSFF